MGLSIEDRLKRFVPGPIYYRYKIRKEMRRGEPELGKLRDLVPAGCTAVDVGANRGFYSYALSEIASRVEAFEPNRALAEFARRKLPSNVTVHEMALGNRETRETFFVPQTTPGIDSHLIGNIGNVFPTVGSISYEVRVARLDGFAFESVGFIKIDVEGSELEVIEGAVHTIERWRPNLVVELQVGWHNSESMIDKIGMMLRYDPILLPKSYNVLFVPRR